MGVERQKEPDVTGLPAQSLEGVGREDKKKKELRNWTWACATARAL